MGVVVKTFKHTPLLNGEAESTGRFKIVLKYDKRAGDLDLTLADLRPVFSNCLNVGICMENYNKTCAYLSKPGSENRPVR